MKKVICFSIFLLLIIACNQKTENKITVNGNDIEMVADAFQNALFGIRTAEEAITRGTSVETKTLAEHFVTNYVRIRNDLQELSGKKGFELPLDITDRQVSSWRSLVTKKGWEFDKAFLDLAVKIDSSSLNTLKQLDNEAMDKDIKETGKSLIKFNESSKDIIAEARKNLELEWSNNADTLIHSLSVNK